VEIPLESYTQRREELLSRVRKILIDRLHVRRTPDEIDPDTSLFLSGLGLDSVDMVELVVACEAEFGVTIRSGTAGRARLRTLNNVVDFVISEEEKRLGA
jgi:acyl carrier protein